MRNKALAITRRTIPYIKELRPITKSVTGAILMQQLDYWFDQKPNGFYKFQAAAPGNQYYKKGDSWEEELAFSPKEFRTAFDKIGVRYPTKKAYDEAVDNPFLKGLEEKLYCSYFDKVRGQTFYYRNHKLVDSTLDQIYRSGSPYQSDYLEVSPPYQSESPHLTNRSLPTLPIGVSPPYQSESPLNTESTNREYSESTLTQDARTQNQNPAEGRGQTWAEVLNEKEEDLPQLNLKFTEPKQPAAPVQINSSALTTVQQAVDLKKKPVPPASSAQSLIHATQAGELNYFEFGWGTGFTSPDPEFLKYAWSNHIKDTSGYKGKNYSDTLAKKWLRKARTDQNRLEDAVDLCSDWQSTLHKESEWQEHGKAVIENHLARAIAEGIIPKDFNPPGWIERSLKTAYTTTSEAERGIAFGEIKREIERQRTLTARRAAIWADTPDWRKELYNSGKVTEEQVYGTYALT